MLSLAISLSLSDLTTGILGGFTTFSAFSLDAVVLYERGGALANGDLCRRLSCVVHRRPVRWTLHHASVRMRDHLLSGVGTKTRGVPMLRASPFSIRYVVLLSGRVSMRSLKRCFPRVKRMEGGN